MALAAITLEQGELTIELDEMHNGWSSSCLWAKKHTLMLQTILPFAKSCPTLNSAEPTLKNPMNIMTHVFSSTSFISQIRTRCTAVVVISPFFEHFYLGE